IVKILVHGLTGMNLVLDAVKTSHEQGSKAQIRVCRRIRETNFQTLGLRRIAEWNTARSRTVASRVGKQNRGFVTRNQTLVRVGRRVGEGIHGLGVLDDATDEVKAVFRQAGIFVTSEGWLAFFPDREMDVHARTV